MTWLYRRLASAAALAAALLAAAIPSGAQESGAGFTPDPGEPIEVVSDTAEWKRADNLAIFAGRVDAVQGTMRLRADRVFVHYLPSGQDDGPAEAQTGPGAGQRITKIDARGSVIITDDTDQTATGDWAIYDVPARRITMGDTVVLTQGDNVIRGQRLVSNLDTGETQVEAGDAGTAGSEGGRVRSLFVTGGDEQNGTQGQP